MANHRRYHRNRYSGSPQARPEEGPFYAAQDQGRYEDDGYIARHGFGNPSAGYDRKFGYEERYDIGREPDFPDVGAATGPGGSTRDWRDVVGEDRRRGETAYGIDYGRSEDRDYYGSSYDHDHERYGAGYFGRGSRDFGEERSLLERASDEIRSWFGDEEADRRREMDVRISGHRGRGPKGYQRSDARILEDVNDRLTDDSHIDATEIEVSVLNCEVTLTGTVNSRFEKRHAEDIADCVAGVRHVQNNLRIQQYVEPGMGGSMLSGPS